MAALVPENIKTLIESKLHDLGFELFDLKYLPAGSRAILRIVVDGEQGVTIGDCERISNALSIMLDVEDFSQTKPYNLEISTPGIDRPLKTEKDFRRTVNRYVVLNMLPVYDGKKTVRGRVVKCDSEKLTVEINETLVELPLAVISSGKEEIQFN